MKVRPKCRPEPPRSENGRYQKPGCRLKGQVINIRIEIQILTMIWHPHKEQS